MSKINIVYVPRTFGSTERYSGQPYTSPTPWNTTSIHNHEMKLCPLFSRSERFRLQKGAQEKPIFLIEITKLVTIL